MSSKPLLTFPPPPVSGLARYRTLSPLASIRVSPLCLGGMSIGDKWQEFGMGFMDKESSFNLLNTYFDLGGNFIDTANSYQDESSEEFIGEWAEKRNIRDQLVIATKYTMNYKRGRDDITHKVNYTGNHAKSLHVSVQESLKKLRTSYIDILYVHWWDYTASVEEVMSALYVLVLQGKVLYLGISGAPAWVVSPFVIYQGPWSIFDRSLERDILPMVRSEGLALAPWGVLGAGKVRTDEEEERRKSSGENGRTLMSPNWERTDQERKVCLVLKEIAKEVGVESITAVTIAYHLLKAHMSSPSSLRENLQALDISLTPEQIQRIESTNEFEPCFSYNIFRNSLDDPWPVKTTAHIDRVPVQQAIRPSN
ncbi:aryl-alcohol dehydrogenase [Multifurca ochricompacta]|uniref:Aryl-alcohol dehydrogenase n=1 Tax=Multifurca ochricompacta TaxID=376703 RepID=A0AAD4M4S3_9AGAM|nr:aryl-alcohol dehydrogenase [Multifurca ochricompacta]